VAAIWETMLCAIGFGTVAGSVCTHAVTSSRVLAVASASLMPSTRLERGLLAQPGAVAVRAGLDAEEPVDTVEPFLAVAIFNASSTAWRALR
jgi:hypothetical protein